MKLPLHCLICNAGVMALPTRTPSVQGQSLCVCLLRRDAMRDGFAANRQPPFPSTAVPPCLLTSSWTNVMHRTYVVPVSCDSGWPHSPAVIALL